VEIEVYVEEGDATARDAAFGDLLQQIGVVLEADPTLGGLAFGLTYGRPETSIEAMPGSPAIKSATLTVTIDYESGALSSDYCSARRSRWRELMVRAHLLMKRETVYGQAAIGNYIRMPFNRCNLGSEQTTRCWVRGVIHWPHSRRRQTASLRFPRHDRSPPMWALRTD
jgi:hypothetical protein